MTKRKWTREEEEMLIKFFNESKSYKFMKTQLNRSRLAIYHRAKLLRIVSDHMKDCQIQKTLRKQKLRRCYLCHEIFPLSDFIIKNKRCKKCNNIKSMNDNRNLSEDKVFYRRWREAKKRANKNKLEFSISVDDIKTQYLNQNGICYYTGNNLQVKILPKSKSFNSISIDRIDSTKGYTKENIVICGNFVNKMKNNLNVNDFIKVCSQVVKFSMMRNSN